MANSRDRKDGGHVTNICIIPARGESRRVPNKNIKEFSGYPVIKYSIDAAKESKLFDKIIVSTDSDRIGTIAAKYGAIYYRRKQEYAGAEIPMVDTVFGVLQHDMFKGMGYKYCCMIYPCAPFITSAKLIQGYQKLRDGYDVVFPIYQGEHIERVLSIRNDRLMSRFPLHDNENSNKWPDSYYHAGEYFWADCAKLILNHTFMQENKYGIIVPKIEVQDIDTPEDWAEAEMRYQILHGKK